MYISTKFQAPTPKNVIEMETCLTQQHVGFSPLSIKWL